jgi:DNA-binding transcriptional ArsR family regulator
MAGEEAHEFDWAAFAARFVNPTKIAVVELLLRARVPLSPTEMVKLFDREDYYLSLVSHHARSLEKAGVLVVVDTGRKRGAVEHFYAITDHMLVRR